MKHVPQTVPRSIRLLAPAKLNLHLEVLKRRHDGYHEIETILQAVDIQDLLDVSLLAEYPGGEPRIDLQVQPYGSIPDDETNLCWQAARAFCRTQRRSGHLRIELKKDIPAGAGLGGGSSDAMAVLIACNRIFATDLDDRQLALLGAEIGSDVPFFLMGGTQLGRGRGTDLTPLPTLRQVHFVVLKPAFSVATGSAYADLKLGLTVRPPVANLQVIKPLLARFPSRPWFGFNRLEDVVLPAHPELSRLLMRLREETPLAMLTGSGSAVFGVCDRVEQAVRLLREFSPSMEFARSVSPLAGGVRIVDG
ncbi:MAG: 4-(cytidine 5'-diphospho)-2-C-methyl-D-erythritol kinase [Candidatus Krumholzibacteria bacterium]|nr:4-(cytidine 5'-diphospho)-2-C-methyl-D-erythritol kinase [Candidatus Krumholzibacteria bacterium]